MSAAVPIREEDLHAYIDGELPADRAAEVEAAMEASPALAERIAAFASDKAALAALYRPIAEAPVPAAWIARIERAARPAPPRRAPPVWTRGPVGWAMALAACLVLAIGGIALRRAQAPGSDIVAQATAVWEHRLEPSARLTGGVLADAARRDQAVTQAVGLKLRAPDLSRLGWTLQEVDTYAQSASLRYAGPDGKTVTLLIRKSSGTPRFDMLKQGHVFTCVWVDEVLGTVMMGNVTAGQMMRVASAAYLALSS